MFDLLIFNSVQYMISSSFKLNRRTCCRFCLWLSGHVWKYIEILHYANICNVHAFSNDTELDTL